METEKKIIGRCPLCGGSVVKTCKGYRCEHNIGGHQITLAEATDICEKGITASELEMYRDDGSIYRKRLGLAPDKLQIVKV